MSNEYDSTTSKDYKLTTVDNPFDPFEDFTSWFMFDVEKGYNTCSYLARIAQFSDDMTQKEIDEETERAIDEIIKYDFANIYIKISKNSQIPENINNVTTEQDTSEV